MIVYNVQRAWFPMKNDAEAYRRQYGFGPEALYKLTINDRDELAALLNAMTGMEAFKEYVQQAPMQIPAEVIERNQIEVPDCVPLFLAKSRAEGKEIKWIKSDE